MLSRRISSDKAFHESVLYVGSVEEACEVVAHHGGRGCVIGGVEVYDSFLSVLQVTQVYVTTVYAPDLVGDTHFSLDAGFHLFYRQTGSSIIRRWHDKDEYETSHTTYSLIHPFHEA